MQPLNLSGNQDFHHHLTGNNLNEAEMYRLLANYGGFQMDTAGHKFNNTTSSNYNTIYPIELSEVTDSNPEAKALAASHQHKEAERRRRERINAHLDRLRSLLPCNSKTDKASLLAKVVERVKELKEETSEIIQLENFPSEADEITVLSNDNITSADGNLLIKASLSCEDRSELLPDLIELMKSLHLSPVRAEMVTLGGRVRNVIVLTGDKDRKCDDMSVSFFRDGLKSLIHRSNYGSGDRPKRRRVFDQEFMS